MPPTSIRLKTARARTQRTLLFAQRGKSHKARRLKRIAVRAQPHSGPWRLPKPHRASVKRGATTSKAGCTDVPGQTVDTAERGPRPSTSEGQQNSLENTRRNAHQITLRTWYQQNDMAFIVHWNFRGPLNDSNDVKDILATHSPVALCVQETNLGPKHKDIPIGYEVFRCDNCPKWYRSVRTQT